MDSTSPSARVMTEEELEMELDDLADGIEIHIPAVVLGDQVQGTVYFVVHDCPQCHSKMTTGGVGFPIMYCAECQSMRNRKVEMIRRFERMSDD